jgi:hypothetical protein
VENENREGNGKNRRVDRIGPAGGTEQVSPRNSNTGNERRRGGNGGRNFPPGTGDDPPGGGLVTCQGHRGGSDGVG